MKTEGLATIEQLLKNTEGVPVRYSTVAALMQYDLESLRDQSLDEVARKMTDVERRLELGRTGQKVQKKEDEIIVTLDELIKKIEEQRRRRGRRRAAARRTSRARPANDSVIKGSTAPGKVDPKSSRTRRNGAICRPSASQSERPDRPRIPCPLPRRHRRIFPKKAANRPAVSGK